MAIRLGYCDFAKQLIVNVGVKLVNSTDILSTIQDNNDVAML
jgi:hypothetical protein